MKNHLFIARLRDTVVSRLGGVTRTHHEDVLARLRDLDHRQIHMYLAALDERDALADKLAECERLYRQAREDARLDAEAYVRVREEQVEANRKVEALTAELTRETAERKLSDDRAVAYAKEIDFLRAELEQAAEDETKYKKAYYDASTALRVMEEDWEKEFYERQQAEKKCRELQARIDAALRTLDESLKRDRLTGEV